MFYCSAYHLDVVFEYSEVTDCFLQCVVYQRRDFFAPQSPPAMDTTLELKAPHLTAKLLPISLAGVQGSLMELCQPGLSAR